MTPPSPLADRADAATNLALYFFDQAERYGEDPFLWAKAGGAWQPRSWRAVAEDVSRLARALGAHGIRRGDRVVLVSENRPEWCIADLAIMAAGAITVPAYTTNGEADHAHVLTDSGAVAAIVSTTKLAATLLPAVAGADACRLVIAIEPLRVAQASGTRIVEWAALMASQRADVAATRAQITAGRADLACLIYTSGTGGTPRGVKQHHGAILQNVAAACEIIEQDFVATEGRDSFLSFLPLSHAYEHTCGQFTAIGLGASIHYAEGLDKLAANMEEVRPTIMVVVPRLFEVLRQRIGKGIEKQGGAAITLFNAALRLGRKRYERGGTLPLADRAYDLVLDRTIRRRVQQRFGGRLKTLVSGGAPLNPDVGLFFAALGLTLCQGYGQTEAGPLISCNRPRAKIKMHSVGPALRGTTVRIAADGEICVRGELVMDGYWKNDVDSHRALQDGWLLTGDIGRIDADGHLVITDRKKDILVNDKGDNISPARVEGMLTLQPEIAQAMVHGDRRPYLVGLVVPDAEWALCWAHDRGMPADLARLRDEPEFVRAVMTAVDRVNARVGAHEKVRRIAVADDPFSVDNGEMTPSLKIRRHRLEARYGARLDALYRSG
ncbi:MAG: long-chain fatty acid--CoA ligase [Sphingomonadaceae bacterium]|nr:long-chain fatty acid--CoA ligase [Sphingomonadaceae bacterium]